MKLTKDDTRAKIHALANSKDLDPFLERVGDARIVMLGEASHGTHEYYTWRSAITKRLIEEKGFHFIAVEGDWPDCYRVNRYIKGYADQNKTPEQILRAFNRWPTWMWANWEIVALTTWLKDYNAKRHAGERVGFYGLDVYSLWESLEMLIKYLKTTDPEAAKIAEKVMDCFSGYEKNEKQYAVNSLTSSCREDAIKLLKEIRVKAPYYNQDPEAALNSTQNAFVAVEAENYYSHMIGFDNETWNIRDRHMMETLNRVLDFHGPDSKAIVWEHNTHVGDARYTDMKKSGMFNIGQLAREQYSENAVVILGFGSYSGTVMAGAEWGGTMQEMELPEAIEGSVEKFLHDALPGNHLIIFDRTHEYSRGEAFNKVMPHRAIGVVYQPNQEQENYVRTHFDRRYDAFIFLDETTALHPLHIPSNSSQVPATFPFEF
jgi:erythromycin esterase